MEFLECKYRAMSEGKKTCGCLGICAIQLCRVGQKVQSERAQHSTELDQWKPNDCGRITGLHAFHQGDPQAFCFGAACRIIRCVPLQVADYFFVCQRTEAALGDDVSDFVADAVRQTQCAVELDR